MVDTLEYYGETYPEPHEVIDDDEYDDFDLDLDLDYADVYHELEMLGMLKDE